MSFDQNRKKDVVRPYELVRLSLPMVATTCTLGDGEGWYTPKTCKEDQTGFYSLWFATPDFDYKAYQYIPRGVDQLDRNIYPCIKSISETPTRLDPEEGLASRGTLTIIFEDFKGDPGPVRRTEFGMFFDKLSERNVLENSPVTLHLGHHQDHPPVYNDFQVREYRIDALKKNFDGSWTMTCKDPLFILDKDETVWPIQHDSRLRADINDTTTTIPVDSDTDYSSATWVRIGDEFLKVNSVTGNQTASAVLNVAARGTSVVVNGQHVSRTSADEHDAGDEVFICFEASDMRIDTLLREVLLDVGLSPGLINSTQWKDEIDVWHPTTRVNTLFHTPRAANETIIEICRDYLLDIWFEPTENRVKLSAISVWRDSDTVVKEGEGITEGTLEWDDDSDMRYTRASVLYQMKNLTEGDDFENFRKLSVFVNARAEKIYNGPRLRQLPSSRLLDKPSGDLLVQRFVSRFSKTPRLFDWDVCEKYLDYKAGDVVDIESPRITGFDGLPVRPRAQILEVSPRYTKTGRFYKVEALTYEQPSGSSGSNEFTLTGRIYNVNLFIAAGAPPEPVEVTFILNNVTIGSPTMEAAIKAGNFATGSKINIIVIGKMSSKGGNGGAGGTYFNESQIDHFCNAPGNGGAGGIVYQSNGIDTDIYLAGTFSGITANGYLYAPGAGGRGGYASCGTQQNPKPANYGSGAGGGAGIPGGKGGRVDVYVGGVSPDAYGSPGQEDGTPGNAGIPKAPGSAGQTGATWGTDTTTGSAGKGLVKTGTEVINVYTNGDTSRFINGHGDAPDSLT